MMHREDAPAGDSASRLQQLLDENGFDAAAHEQLRSEYRAGRIGLAQNRLPATTVVEDVCPEHVAPSVDTHANIGRDAIRSGKLFMITMAGGAGSRWTKGAGGVKIARCRPRSEMAPASPLEIAASKASES
jgi:hypothetical protein